MKNIITAIALLLIFGSAGSARAERIWVFGDSLSDNGNLSLLFATDGNANTYLPTAYTPYSLQGVPLQRISNGKIAMEYVADYYSTKLVPSGLRAQLGDGVANNFAIFGARASLTSGLDLPYQVAQLAERVVLRGLNVSSDRAVLAIGSNDLFAAWLAAITPLSTGGQPNLAAGEAILDQAIASLRTYLSSKTAQTIPSPANNGTTIQVPSLAALGLKKFVILNSPDISTTPWVLNTAKSLNNDKRVTTIAAGLTEYFNCELGDLIDELKAKLSIIEIDLQSISNTVRSTAKPAFVNKTEDCFQTNTLATLTQGVAPTPAVYRSTCSAAKANTFFFFDTAHPSARVHQLSGEAIVKKLKGR